ncbi:MAG: hypothetical protein FJ086_07205 [Deltaproteobacteria bacterium]|nr:hypothetical protein [Deltaproteobacteria bacterium]
MCRRVTCSTCHKPTFAGCGAHVEQVLSGVPKQDRCQCSAQAAAQPPASTAAASDGGKPWWKPW